MCGNRYLTLTVNEDCNIIVSLYILVQIRTQAEQKEFFKTLNSQLDSFPQQYCKMKILPLLLNAFDYGSAGSTVLAPLFKVKYLLVL